jgi:hypothetical protein
LVYASVVADFAVENVNVAEYRMAADVAEAAVYWNGFVELADAHC